MLKPQIFLGKGSDGGLILFDEPEDLLGQGIKEGPDVLFVLNEFLFGIARVSYVLDAIEDLGDSFESLHFKFIGLV